MLFLQLLAAQPSQNRLHRGFILQGPGTPMGAIRSFRLQAPEEISEAFDRELQRGIVGF
jgi:hypothetical protein